MAETKVVHCMREPYDVYIGRGRDPKTGRNGPWGNPFAMATEKDRDAVCEQYRAYLRYSPVLLDLLPTLVGKTLACWCHPKRCHGDIIIEVMKERGLI